MRPIYDQLQKRLLLSPYWDGVEGSALQVTCLASANDHSIGCGGSPLSTGLKSSVLAGRRPTGRPANPLSTARWVNRRKMNSWYWANTAWLAGISGVVWRCPGKFSTCWIVKFWGSGRCVTISPVWKSSSWSLHTLDIVRLSLKIEIKGYSY